MSRSHVLNGTRRRSVNDDVRTIRRRIAVIADNIDTAEKCSLEDRRATVSTIAAELSPSVGSVEKIIREHLKFRKVSVRWVPKQLNGDQKQPRDDVSRGMVNRYRRKEASFLSRIIYL